MAMTKAVLLRKMVLMHSSETRAIEQQADEVDANIDRVLLRGYVGAPVTIQMNGPLNIMVQSAIQYRYTEAGWKITFHADEETGAYWIVLE